jgi:Rieske Fe-S protein
MITIKQLKIIKKLYPNVISTIGDIAYDAEGNQIEIDLAAVNAWQDPDAYKIARAKEYPPITDYLDGIVKGDQEQIDAYIAACQAVKNKYPKPE